MQETQGGFPGGSEANRRCRAHEVVRSKLEQTQKYATFRPFPKSWEATAGRSQCHRHI